MKYYIILFIMCGAHNINCQETETEPPDPDCEKDIGKKSLVYRGDGPITLNLNFGRVPDLGNVYFVRCKPSSINFTFYDNNMTKIETGKPNGRYHITPTNNHPGIFLKIQNMTVYDGGRYKMEAHKGNYSSVKYLDIIVHAIASPVLKKEDGKYFCNVTGYPMPDVSWYFKQNNSDIPKLISKDIITEQPSRFNWSFSYFIHANQSEVKDVGGTLSCNATNRHASNIAELIIEPATPPTDDTKDDTTDYTLIISIIILLLIIIIICAYLCYKFYNILENVYYSACSKYKPGIKLRVAGLLNDYGQLECPRGAFGQPNDKTTHQRVTHTSNMNDIRMLVAELNTISSIGRHLNIVKLLNVSTEAGPKGELYVIKERCEYGDIIKYIKDNRATLVLAASNPIPRSEGAWLLPHYRTVRAENPLYEYLCTQDWLKAWAFQVACGMDFLQSQQIFYKSTKDILLSDDGVVKITRFSDREHVALYEPTKKLDRLEGSDFRSYAAFLRQLFFLAEVPESNTENSREIENHESVQLRPRGNHLEQPELAIEQQIQDVILQCDKKGPADGMQFSQIARTLEELNPQVHLYYVSRNSVNLQYNIDNATAHNKIKDAWNNKKSASKECLPALKCYSQVPSHEVT